jgi:stage II sporulation protein R
MRRKLNVLKKTAVITAGIIILSLLAAVVSGGGFAGGSVRDSYGNAGGVTAGELSSKLIRLHVIANSDSPEDQALKLRVRDRIIEALNMQLQGIDDIEESREFIKTHLGFIEDIARKEIEKSGKDYTVKAVFGKFPFPVKSYGYITLPAGEYEALRVILGKGRGANWWCVLFPPLCFVDITHGVARDEVRLQLSRVLTPEELAAIETASAPEKVPVEVRFKVVEWLQAAGSKIGRTIKLAFK